MPSLWCSGVLARGGGGRLGGVVPAGATAGGAGLAGAGRPGVTFVIEFGRLLDDAVAAVLVVVDAELLGGGGRSGGLACAGSGGRVGPHGFVAVD